MIQVRVLSVLQCALTSHDFHFRRHHGLVNPYIFYNILINNSFLRAIPILRQFLDKIRKKGDLQIKKFDTLLDSLSRPVKPSSSISGGGGGGGGGGDTGATRAPPISRSNPQGPATVGTEGSGAYSQSRAARINERQQSFLQPHPSFPTTSSTGSIPASTPHALSNPDSLSSLISLNSSLGSASSMGLGTTPDRDRGCVDVSPSFEYSLPPLEESDGSRSFKNTSSDTPLYPFFSRRNPLIAFDLLVLQN